MLSAGAAQGQRLTTITKVVKALATHEGDADALRAARESMRSLAVAWELKFNDAFFGL